MKKNNKLILFGTLILSVQTSAFAGNTNQQTGNKEPVAADKSYEATEETCNTFQTDDNDRLSNFRSGTHEMLCRTVNRIDSWFGSEHKFDSSDFGGRLILGFRQDEDTGFDPRVRLRLNARLPNASRRFSTFIGRTDDEAFIRDQQVSGIDGLANDLANEDTRWLIGLGYRNPNKTGFETSVGARFSSGLQPFAKLRYRYYTEFGNLSSRFTQTLFWENEDGFGTTSGLQFAKPLSENYLTELGLEATILKDTEVWENAASVTLYKKLSARSGIALRSYIMHESGNNSIVDVPEYGISLSYRQPFLKPWLILKTTLENRWEQEQNNEPRQSFAKLGMQLEMQFGKHKRKR